MNIGFVRLGQGDQAAARRIYHQMVEDMSRAKLSLAGLASLAATLGELDQAFEYFDQAYEERDLLLPMVDIYADLFVPELRRAPRFHDLLTRMKLVG